MSSVDQRSPAPVSPPPASRPRLRSALGHRRWRMVLLAVLLAAAALAVVESIALVRDAKRAQAALEAFKTSLQHNDSPAAARHLHDANADLSAARRRYQSVPLRVLGHVPLLGWPISDAGKLIGAATQVSSAGTDALSIYGQVRGSGSALFANDTVSLPEVASLSQAAGRMVAKMDLAAAQLRRIRGAFWEPGIGHARAGALRQVTQLRTDGRTAQTLLALAPGLLGAEGPRNYLVVVLNPAELQGAGGSALNILCVRFVEGRMQILQSGSTSDLTDLNRPTRFTPLPGDPWMAGLDRQVLAAADTSPDFRTSGQELMRGYTAQFGIRLNGIIALDPLALAALMKQIGPFTTPGYGLVTADNIVKTVLVDSYARFPYFKLRHLYNDDLMNTLMHKILGGGHMIGKGTTMRDAATSGHLQIYMYDGAVQQQVESAGLLRTLPSGGHGDVLGVYTLNGNASKVDYWQQRAIDQQVTLHSDGSADVVRTVQITNAAPAYAGPGADVGKGYLTRVSEPKFFTYLPPGASVQSFTRDGAAVRPTKFDERGLIGLRLPRYPLARGATVTLVIRYSMPAGSFAPGRYVVSLAAQPMVQPTRLHLMVTGPGCRGSVTVDDMQSTETTVLCR